MMEPRARRRLRRLGAHVVTTAPQPPQPQPQPAAGVARWLRGLFGGASTDGGGGGGQQRVESEPPAADGAISSDAAAKFGQQLLGFDASHSRMDGAATDEGQQRYEDQEDAVAGGAPSPGYTLCAPASGDPVASLFDISGAEVHRWTAAGGGVVKCAPYLLADSSVLFPILRGSRDDLPWTGRGAHPNGSFQRVSWEGEILWDYEFFGEDFCPSYDVEPMPNGNVLLCAQHKEAGLPGKLFEIEPVGADGGRVVWECDLTAQLDGLEGYTNSVSYNAELDRVMVNIQTPGHTLAVFDHSVAGGKLLSRFDGFTDRVHGGAFITGQYLGTGTDDAGADRAAMRVGNLLAVSNSDSAVVEIDPVEGREVARLPLPECGGHQGSAQRLPNGNTLVCAGHTENVLELDPDGNVVWSLPVERVARAYRYGPTFPGLAGRGLS
jgi:hypothetical protein